MRYGFGVGDDDFDTSPEKFSNDVSMIPSSLCCQNDVCSITKEEGRDKSFGRSSHGSYNSGASSVGSVGNVHSHHHDESSVNDSDEQEGKYYYGVFTLNQMMERHIEPIVTALHRLKTLAKTNIDGDIAAFFDATADDILERIEQMSSFGIAGCSMLRDQYCHLGSEVLAALEDRAKEKAEEHHLTWTSGRECEVLLANNTLPKTSTPSNQQYARSSLQCTPRDTHDNQDASAFSASENHGDNGHFTSNGRCSDFPLTPDNDDPTCNEEVSEEESFDKDEQRPDPPETSHGGRSPTLSTTQSRSDEFQHSTNDISFSSSLSSAAHSCQTPSQKIQSQSETNGCGGDTPTNSFIGEDDEGSPCKDGRPPDCSSTESNCIHNSAKRPAVDTFSKDDCESVNKEKEVPTKKQRASSSLSCNAPQSQSGPTTRAADRATVCIESSPSDRSQEEIGKDADAVDSLLESETDKCPENEEQSLSRQESADIDNHQEAGSSGTEHLVVDTISLCDQISRNLEESGARSLVVADTHLLNTTLVILKDILTHGDFQFDKLINVAGHVICILGPLTKHSKLLAKHMKSKAIALEAVPDLSSTNDWLTMLSSANAHSERLKRAEVSTKVTEDLTKLRLAIKEHRYPEKQLKEVTDDMIQDFIRMLYITPNLLSHLLELCIMYKFLSKLKMIELYLDTGGEKTFWANAKNLACSVDEGFQLNGETSVLQFILEIVSLGFDMNDLWKDAWGVFIEIKLNLANTKKSSRKELIDGMLIESALNSFSGEDPRRSTSSSNIQGTSTTIDNETKRRMYTLFFSIVGQRGIERAFPEQMFAKGGGLIRSILTLSGPDVRQHCSSFFQKDFHQKVRANDAIINKIRKNVLKDRVSAVDNAGKRSIIVESRAEIDSLRSLVELMHSFASQH